MEIILKIKPKGVKLKDFHKLSQDLLERVSESIDSDAEIEVNMKE